MTLSLLPASLISITNNTMSQKIRIKLKSYDHTLVEKSAEKIVKNVKAIVPLAEMFGYVTALRTITSGRATSSMQYDHHEQVSNSIAKAVLEEVKGRTDLIK